MEARRIMLYTICSLMFAAILYQLEECFHNMEEYPWGKWEFVFFLKNVKFTAFWLGCNTLKSYGSFQKKTDLAKYKYAFFFKIRFKLQEVRKLQRTTTWQQRTFTRHTARGKCSPQVLFSPVDNPFQSPSVLAIRFLLNIFFDKLDLFLQPQNIILRYFNEFTEIFYETKLSSITRILSIFLVIQLSLFYLASKTIQKELSRLSIHSGQ